jgi:hypothetical protein
MYPPAVKRPSVFARRRTEWRGSALLLTAAVLGTGAAIGLAACGTSEQGTPAPGPTPAERARISAALQSAHAACAKRSATPPSRSRVRRSVQTLLDLYREYPTQRFTLSVGGGESAHMLSALLVAREVLRRCRPRQAAMIDRALPAGVGRAPGQ